MKKIILVTGATGFIGSNLILHLLNKASIELIMIDNFSSSKKEVYKILKQEFQKKRKKFNFYKVNLIDFKKVFKIFKQNKIDQIIHLAAFSDATQSMKKKKIIFKK